MRSILVVLAIVLPVGFTGCASDVGGDDTPVIEYEHPHQT